MLKTFSKAVIVLSSILVAQALSTTRPLLAQPIAEDHKAALSEVLEALREDSAELESQIEPEPEPAAEVDVSEESPEAIANEETTAENVVQAIAQPARQLNQPAAIPSVHLLEQLLAESLNAAYKEPGADALGGAVSVGIETELPADLATDLAIETRTADLSAIASSIRVESATLPALTTALKSDDELVRLYAADALWSLTGDSDLVLPTLISAAESENLDTRELALMALAQLGEEALPAIPVLNDIVGDRDSRTRQIAQDVLNVVQSENRSGTVLGIIAREANRMGGFSALFKAISDLW